MAKKYDAGNLSFQIQSTAKNTTAIFSSLNEQLTTMSNLVGGTVKTFNSLVNSAKSMSRLSFNWTKKLVDGLNSIQEIDTSNFYKKMDSLTKIMTPFVDKIVSAEKSLTALQNVLNSTKGKRTIKLPNIENQNEKEKNPIINPKTLKNFSLNQILNKVYFLRNYTKQMARNIAQIIQDGIDYNETLNLWQVAMRGNRKEAEEFINTMNKAYGISTKTLMNYQAIFKNMLSTLGGISNNISYQLSEYLTQMALDYASLYNVSIERAMTTFQSVLSGQVRPIRAISGMDITEMSIYQLYQQLGGTKTMRQLTQTEKRLLRIYAVFQQMETSGAIGDLNKTLNSTANQLRILRESGKELSTWLGLLFESIIKPILPYLTAIVITTTNIVKAIAKARNLQFAEGVTEQVEELNTELEKTKGNLLDFDKFSVLNIQSNTDNNLGIDQQLLNFATRYESILSSVNSQAQELANTWTKMFVDDKTGELSKNFNSIMISLYAILGYLIGIKSLDLLKDTFELLSLSKETGSALKVIAKDVGGVSKGTFVLANAIKFLTSPLGIVLSVLGLVYATNEDFRESVNRIFVLLFNLVTQVLNPILPIITNIVNILGFFVNNIIAPILTFFVDFASLLLFVVYPLELGIKLISTLLELLNALTKFNFSELGNNLKNLWSNWATNDLLNSVANSFTGSYSKNIQSFSNGGVIEDGIFTMNRGEIAGKFNNGKSVVANNEQIITGIENAAYRGYMRAFRDSVSGGKDIILKVDSRELARATVNANATALNSNYKIDLQPR